MKLIVSGWFNLYELISVTMYQWEVRGRGWNSHLYAEILIKDGAEKE